MTTNQIMKYKEQELIPQEKLPQTKKQAVQLLISSPMPYWESINPKTVLDVFKAPQVSITEMKDKLGEAYLQALMVKWMNSFLRFYSTNGAMDALQVADTIVLIMEEYPHYTQDDFKLFFKMAKKGTFGQVYGRMDGEVILNWLKAYDRHRDTVAQDESINEAKRQEQEVQDDSESMFYDEYISMMQSMAKNGDENAQKRIEIHNSILGALRPAEAKREEQLYRIKLHENKGNNEDNRSI